MQSFPELLAEVEYHYHKRPYGDGKVLFEKGRFALVSQTLTDGEHSLLMVVGRRSPNPDKEKLFLVLQLPKLKAKVFKNHALLLRQIVERLVEIDDGGWKYIIQTDDHGTQTCKLRNSVGQEIEFYNASATYEEDKSPRTTRRLKSLLGKLEKADVDGTCSQAANRLVVEEVEALFKADTSKELLNAVISIHPHVDADQQINLLEEALEALKASHAQPAEALVSKNA